MACRKTPVGVGLRRAGLDAGNVGRQRPTSSTQPSSTTKRWEIDHELPLDWSTDNISSTGIARGPDRPCGVDTGLAQAGHSPSLQNPKTWG
ncbi:hypothetical protein QC763_0068640 [Podospora pseudopauciseta]|uniref:Transposase n=1 Tax=Podospora pseudopauciseta TaxID=2093780 RepID=A0ABR0HDF7_9PEZI|nr:hypothetical protein QC763_0068640 [Podospora pseudopauciseta]